MLIHLHATLLTIQNYRTRLLSNILLSLPIQLPYILFQDNRASLHFEGHVCNLINIISTCSQVRNCLSKEPFENYPNYCIRQSNDHTIIRVNIDPIGQYVHFVFLQYTLILVIHYQTLVIGELKDKKSQSDVIMGQSQGTKSLTSLKF